MSHDTKKLVARLNQEVTHERLVRFHASEYDHHIVMVLRRDTMIKYPAYDIERDPKRFFGAIEPLIEFAPEGQVLEISSSLKIVDMLVSADKMRKKAEERAEAAEKKLEALDISAEHIGGLIGVAKKAMEGDDV